VNLEGLDSSVSFSTLGNFANMSHLAFVTFMYPQKGSRALLTEALLYENSEKLLILTSILHLLPSEVFMLCNLVYN